MSYSMVNLRDAQDKAPDFGLSEVQEARFPREEVGAETTGFAHHLIHPNRRQGFGHRHQEAEEVYLAIRGSGRARLDDEVLDIAERDVLRVSPQVTRAFEAGPDGLELLVFGPRHEGDGEIVQDFWTD